MSRIDLHVDGLMDRARQGALSASEHRRLLAHCERCAACRLELHWIADGIHAREPSADDRARGAAAVDALLGAAAPAPPPALRARPRASAPWQTAALALAGLLAASAAAALYTGVQHWRERTTPALPSATPRADPPRPPPPPRRRAPAPAFQAPTPSPALAPAPAPALSPPLIHARAPGSSSGSGSRSGSASTPAVAAEALFARANAERALGRHALAAAAYAELARDYPGTRSEIAARISRGHLLLHRMHEPAQALSAFASYLAARPDGPLSEEARVGVAISLQRLGRSLEEREAWRSLLERHPDSLHAPRARARLAQLPR